MELFKLLGTIAVDNGEANANIDATSQKASDLGTKFKTGLATAARVGAAAVTAATGAVVALTTKSVEAYAEYEQLVGGVETLFSDSADIIMGYAEQAYRTAGLSANEYMETVTSFSASLLQGLHGDTAAAAEIADMAITDMSDNANKMGTSMELLQNAYQGFAKQNYTMLDNLKLGYGGTQEEMIRLINDSGILNEEISSLDGITFDQIIEAIHAVQTEMGITGTTALEASTTIQGSISTMKAAWDNLLVGMSDDTADFEVLMSDFVDSVGTVAENLLPRITIALEGVGQLVTTLAPLVAQEFPKMVNILLPSALSAALTIVQGIVAAAPELLSNLMALAPEAVSVITEIGVELTAALLELTPELLMTVMEIFESVLLSLSEAIPEITSLISTTVADVIVLLAESAPDLLAAGVDLFLALAEAIPLANESLILRLPEIVTAITTALTESIPILLEGATEFLTNGIIPAIPMMCEALTIALPQVVDAICSYYVTATPILIDAGIQLLLSLCECIPQVAAELVVAAPQLITAVGSALIENAPLLLESATQAFMAILQAIPVVFAELGSSLVSAAQEIQPIMQEEVGGIFAGAVEAIHSNLQALVSGEVFVSLYQSVVDSWTTTFQTVKDTVSEKIEGARAAVQSAIEKIKSYFDFEWSLPHLKLPHLSVTGSFSLNPPSVPTFSVQWYQKAMDNAMLLNAPTIFGMDQAGNMLGGGEAGQEVVAGSQTLMSMIGDTVAQQNYGVVAVLDQILSAIISMDDNMGGNMREALDGTGISINNREFGRLVKAVT